MLTVPSSIQNPSFIAIQRYEVVLAHLGQGNWSAFRAIGVSLPDMMDIARSWADIFSRIDRPWLCWNVDDDWSIVQQRLVASVGWTPVVGFDPRVGPPRRAIPEAVIINFNQELGLPILYPHFPLEFAFLFCSKIAFWHSDLLMRQENMREVASIFAQLPDGETAAVKSWGGWRNSLTSKKRRFWELVGCTTREASRDQFEKGCGWWMDFSVHPNQPRSKYIRKHFYWDHGSGIYYWYRHQGGNAKALDDHKYHEGHFTKIGNKNYRGFRESDSGSDARRNMSSEIKDNFDLVRACRSLSLDHYL